MDYRSHSESYLDEMRKANPTGLDYLIRNERHKQDHTNKVPNKTLTKEKLPWGFYGYTYQQHTRMWLNNLLDYTPDFKEEVEVHEAIHTPNEYETREIAEDMVKKESREDILKRILQN